MLAYIFLIILPETIVFLTVYYFRSGGANTNILFLYLIPAVGSFLPFLMLKKTGNFPEKLEVNSYLNTTGMSMISLFYNSTALLMWKLGASFLWLLPIFVVEPIVGLIYHSRVKRVGN